MFEINFADSLYMYYFEAGVKSVTTAKFTVLENFSRYQHAGSMS